MNSFGRIFKVEIFGESHGHQVGVVVDGCPAGIPLCEDDFNEDIQRRRSGKIGTTPRIEADIPHIVSGVFNGKTCGTPHAAQDARPCNGRVPHLADESELSSREVCKD